MVSALIANLSADDAAARRTAADKLVQLGLAARPAVVAAAHGDDPEIRSQAAALLLKMPWSQPSDPEDVRKILDQYANYADTAQPPLNAQPMAPEDNRKAAVRALASLPNDLGWDALVRLVYEDPSNSVRWMIVDELWQTDTTAHMAALRKTDAPADDPPLAALYGLAWMTAGSPNAIPLLNRAVQEEFTDPSDDGGMLDVVITCLVDLDENARQFDAAAELLRGEIKRGNAQTDRQNVPLPLLRLFALQADHGPLAKWDEDQKTAADFIGTAKMQYAMARIDLRMNQPDAAAAARQTAFGLNATSRLGRYETGKFLADRGWDAEAEAELRAFLAMPPGDEQDDPDASEANVHFELAGIAARRDDDQEAAEQKKSAMSILGGGTGAILLKTDAQGHSWPATQDEIWAEIHWRYLRAANKRKDEPAIAEELQELIHLAPTDEDIAIDVVPILRERKQTDQAKQFFAAAYKEAKGKMEADPGNPVWMNGLAWLDAKCDENLDEALKLATEAVAKMPGDSAVVDTLAEVNYHLGKFDEAVKLETHALELTPGDAFMTGQLARFKAGKVLQTK